MNKRLKELLESDEPFVLPPHPRKVFLDKFVTVWQKANSAKEVAKEMNIPVSWVSPTAYKLRKQGINLKKIPFGGYGAVGWHRTGIVPKKWNPDEV